MCPRLDQYAADVLTLTTGTVRPYAPQTKIASISQEINPTPIHGSRLPFWGAGSQLV
jgi:hypothetical protein